MTETALNHERAVTLLMQHRTALYGFIFACVRNQADTEDLLQDVAVTTMECVGQLREDAEFLPWALQIARNRVLRHRRKSAQQQPLNPTLVTALADAAVRIERNRSGAVAREALMACLEELPAESRFALAKRYDCSFDNVNDLAATLGRSTQGAYALIKRTKSLLRDCVERRMTRGAP